MNKRTTKKPPKGWSVSRDEWVCPHGVGHPIPGQPHHADGLHGCDGCCASLGPGSTPTTEGGRG
jgi:hypothetical protein